VATCWSPRLDLGDSQDFDLPELRVRAGAIVPMGPVMQHVDEKPLDPLTLVIALDDKGQATGTLYEDAGDGWGFREKDYALSTYTASLAGDTVTVRRTSVDGKIKPPARRVDVRVLAGGAKTTGSGNDGEDIKVTIPR
jgi:alpha-glucosidase